MAHDNYYAFQAPPSMRASDMSADQCAPAAPCLMDELNGRARSAYEGIAQACESISNSFARLGVPEAPMAGQPEPPDAQTDESALGQMRATLRRFEDAEHWLAYMAQRLNRVV